MTAEDANTKREQIIIGWKERIALPEWDVERIVAKADTGARTGAIDVADIRELPGDRVHFEVVVERNGSEDHELVRKAVVAPIVRRSVVRSSFGASHDRFFVETLLSLGPVRKRIQLGLVDRKHMLCRLLLGRAALEPEFLVDSSRRYLFGRRRPARKRPRKDADS